MFFDYLFCFYCLKMNYIADVLILGVKTHAFVEGQTISYGFGTTSRPG